MKVFFPLGAFYPSQIGGPCNTLYWHCCALKDNSVEPIVITTNIGINNNIVLDKFIELECGSVFYSSKSLKSLSVLKKINSHILAADVIHLNSLFNIFSIYSYFFKLFFNKKQKIIWSVRGELDKNALKFSKLKKIPVLYFYRQFNKNIIFHSTSSQETQNILRYFPKNKIIVIPNLIKPNKRLKVNKNKNLLYVGRLHPIKNIHKVIISLAECKVFLRSDSKFLIVGKQEERYNNYKNELIELIKRLSLNDKVIFLGHLEGYEKEKIYAESYALILASDTENFGNVVIESLNQGTPVIASLGTPWSILEDYNAGLHVDNSTTELSKAIDKLLSLNENDYQELIKNAYKLVDENFIVEKQIYRWNKIYSNLK